MNTSAAHHRLPHHGLAPGRLVPVLARLVVNFLAPVLAYLLLRPHLHNDITALVIGAAVPIAYTAALFLLRRRVDAIGVVAIVCFVIGLLLVIATGGNELVFKLREDIWTGPLGLACLISVAVRRPLIFLVLQLIARRNPRVAQRLQRPETRQADHGQHRGRRGDPARARHRPGDPRTQHQHHDVPEPVPADQPGTRRRRPGRAGVVDPPPKTG